MTENCNARQLVNNQTRFGKLASRRTLKLLYKAQRRRFYEEQPVLDSSKATLTTIHIRP